MYNVYLFLVHQIIHDSLHDEIVDKLKKAYGQVCIGDPLDGKLHVGVGVQYVVIISGSL